jgi:hypothetical protein
MAAPQYRGRHQQALQQYRAAFTSGQPCAECGHPLYASERMHLSHDHINGGYKGLSHMQCNIAEGNRRRAKPRVTVGWRW